MSWYKYQANSMITFDSSSNFDKNILNHIQNTPPTRSQQIIIPNDEQIRLINLYQNYNEKIVYFIFH